MLRLSELVFGVTAIGLVASIMSSDKYIWIWAVLYMAACIYLDKCTRAEKRKEEDVPACLRKNSL